MVHGGVRVPAVHDLATRARHGKEKAMTEINDMPDEVQNLLNRVPTSKSAGKYLDELSDSGREVLDEFEKWLRTEDPNGLKTESTARAYKGYIAKAIVETVKNPDYELDTDVKSAINALRRFQNATGVSMTDDDPEDEPLEPTGDESHMEPVEVPEQ
jgi:hypothetical protein